ncbi:MAG TPA: aspartate--tRNA(Asn) ligase [Nitrososphaerales archaeon]|nr:aspartate--tRNA(Asn) ligase [Nitrososphaerales archaeon]
MGSWRRSHYSIQITPALDGREVTVFGWVSSIRTQGGIVFIMLTDRDGNVQVTVNKGKASKATLSRVEALKAHSSLAVKGVVKAMPKAPNGSEIVPEEIKILSIAAQTPSFSVYGGETPSLDKRLDIRAVDLRREKAQVTFKVQRVVLSSTREFLAGKGYLEVRTPKLISTATEGGASLFSVLYYNRPSFLAQSPQLYKEELVLPFEKVYEIGPAFRAEESRTQRHLSEITSIDIEEAFVDYNDVMDTLEALIRHVISSVRETCSKDLNLGNASLAVPDKFERLRYTDVVEQLNRGGTEVTWGEDLTGPTIEKLGKDHASFYFITDWPTQSKPFYIKPRDDDPKVSESFDLMHGPLELASGGSRVSSKALLVKRLKEQKLKPQAFEHHLKVFDYGMPPHAGFGLGMERLTMVLAGEENIREVTLYPRDKLRLVP